MKRVRFPPPAPPFALIVLSYTMRTMQDASSSCEVTVLLPCLNEGRSLRGCLQEAKAGILAAGCTGEVLVVDNGSTDDSLHIATTEGVRIVLESVQGYGSALRRGILEARGTYTIMGDADGSYDFTRICDFLPALRLGNHLVIGNRFTGGIESGAMPALHYIGIPILTFVLNTLFRMKIGDAHCGMRGFKTCEARSWNLRTSGMEFASEMIVCAKKYGASIFEIPFPLRKDKRRGYGSHLRSFRDGWRHLSYLVMASITD